MLLTPSIPTLGKLILRVYGEDEILRRDHRKSSSRPIPGRLVNGVWSTLHERGNRKLISYDEVPSHTWVRNAYNAWTMQFLDSDTLGSSTFGVGTLAMKTTSGTGKAFTQPFDIGNAGASNKGFRGASGQAVQGIQAGKGDGAGAAAVYSFENYQLEDLIEEGTTAGDQMNYAAMDDYTVSNVTYSTLVWTLVLQRFMNNNSGTTIVVEEVGLAVEEAGSNDFYLFARDVLGGDAKSVVDMAQLDVTYTIDTPAFPA